MSNSFGAPADVSTEFIKNRKAYTVFDSGVSNILLPSEIFRPYLDEWMKSLEKKTLVFESEGLIFAEPCPEKAPTLFFMFDKTWLSVLPDDYLLDASPELDGTICQLLLRKGDYPFLVMGLPLYNGYYTVHDDKEGKMGFVPHKYSAKKGPFWGTVPTRTLADPSNWVGLKEVDGVLGNVTIKDDKKKKTDKDKGEEEHQ